MIRPLEKDFIKKDSLNLHLLSLYAICQLAKDFYFLTFSVVPTPSLPTYIIKQRARQLE